MARTAYSACVGGTADHTGVGIIQLLQSDRAKIRLYQICLFCAEVERKNLALPLLEMMVLLYYHSATWLLSGLGECS